MSNTVLQAFVTAFEKCAVDPESALAGGGVGTLVGGAGGATIADRAMKAYMARKYGLNKINPAYLKHLRGRARGAGALGAAIPLGLAGALAGGMIGG
jgi:hypothetical protein